MNREAGLQVLKTSLKQLDAELERMRQKRVRLDETIMKLARGAVSADAALEVLK